MTYLYIKKNPTIKLTKKPARTSGSFIKHRKKYIATIFFGLGFYLFTSAVLPIIQFQLEYSIKFNQIISPLSTRYYNRTDSILQDVSATDYTQLSNWFTAEAASPKEVNFITPGSTLTSYKLSVPVLKIYDANVDVGSLDLKKSLLQYAQTSLPG
ncbi:MAG: hypothetical protein WC686_00765, partial [Candidatus Shapirobacteria bacterium]